MNPNPMTVALIRDCCNFINMALIPITNEELEALCYSLAHTEYIYYPVATEFFLDLYNTGARPSELLNTLQWNFIDDDNIILTPDKGNSPRTFISTDLSESLLSAIISQFAPYQGLTLRQLTSVLKKILPVLDVQTIDKSAITYIFRYNKVKRLKAEGKTYAEITSLFGWSSEALATSYALKQLYTTTPIPPPEPNRLIDNAANYITDSAGNYLSF